MRRPATAWASFFVRDHCKRQSPVIVTRRAQGCFSAARRYFTDDYPPEFTQIGFHGHYDNGDLNAASVKALHLKDWIIHYSDGKADEALVERWINIPRGTGLIHFYNPALVNIGGYSTFMCQGTEPDHPQIFDCERLRG